MSSPSAIASFSAACRSLSASAFVLGRAADDHLSVDPDAVSWSSAEHAARLAKAAEALVAEVAAFGRII